MKKFVLTAVAVVALGMGAATAATAQPLQATAQTSQTATRSSGSGFIYDLTHNHLPSSEYTYSTGNG